MCQTLPSHGDGPKGSNSLDNARDDCIVLRLEYQKYRVKTIVICDIGLANINSIFLLAFHLLPTKII